MNYYDGRTGNHLGSVDVKTGRIRDAVGFYRGSIGVTSAPQTFLFAPYRCAPQYVHAADYQSAIDTAVGRLCS